MSKFYSQLLRVNMPHSACSMCLDTGITLAGKPCNCGVSKSPAIAPPVAAGSVDNPPFDLRKHKVGGGEGVDVLNIYINAWGAQQREQGKAEQTAFLKECMDRGQAEFNRKWTEQKERAEKAEARVLELQRVILDQVTENLK